jgi:hypothetical protein
MRLSKGDSSVVRGTQSSSSRATMSRWTHHCSVPPSTRTGRAQPLEQPVLPPQQRIHTGPIELAEPARQDQELVPRHDVDRIHLQDPQPA